MIAGIGVDIVENKRIKLLIKNDKFVERVFSKNEKLSSKKIKNKVNFFSKRYAAKEALSKALGTGIGRGINFKDVSVKNEKLGKPYYELNRNVKKAIFHFHDWLLSKRLTLTAAFRLFDKKTER